MSADGAVAVSGGKNKAVRVWDLKTGTRRTLLKDHTDEVWGVAVSADGAVALSGSDDRTVRVWDLKTNACRAVLKGHTDDVNGVAVSADGAVAVSGALDRTVRVWDLKTNACRAVLEGHTDEVWGVAVSADGAVAVSGSDDRTVRVWDLKTNACRAVLKGHTACLMAVAVSADGSVALSGADDRTVRVWDLRKLGKGAAKKSTHYRAAKIVLVGDSGVGKSVLGYRLAHGKYKTDFGSTHGQQFWLPESLRVTHEDGSLSEPVLWDLAGQPDYRLIHSLFLDDADLALVFTNSTDPSDPLKGVEYWLTKLGVKPGGACRSILIAARCDVSAPELSEQAFINFCKARGVSGGFLRTSAQTGDGVSTLLDRIRQQIPWDAIPLIVTTKTFKRIKRYVLDLKERKHRSDVLADWPALRGMLKSEDAKWKFSDDEMKTAVGHLARHGFVRVLQTSEGEERVLLKPELLNNLAASFVLEARRSPKELGALDDRQVRANAYNFPEVQPLSAAERDTLLDAAALLFVERNVAFREPHGDTSYLIFPELINRKKPPLEDTRMTEGVSYTVSGSVENVYAALVVLLGYTNVFTRSDQWWQNQAEYEVAGGGVCGFRQSAEREGELELVLYYGPETKPDDRRMFQALFEKFLRQRNVTVTRYEPVSCPKCQTRIKREVVKELTRKGRPATYCHECGATTPLPKVGESIALSEENRQLVAHEQEIAVERSKFETALKALSTYITRAESEPRKPRCFISYAWGEERHNLWVRRRLYRDLKLAELDPILDEDHNAAAGGNVLQFMRDAVRKADSVLVIGTPLYLQKVENRYSDKGSILHMEWQMIAADRLVGPSARQETVRPLLLDGDEKTSFPLELRLRAHIDFRKPEAYFVTLFELILSVHGIKFDDPAVSDLRLSLRGESDERRRLGR
jgi:WD40 repeat protein